MPAGLSLPTTPKGQSVSTPTQASDSTSPKDTSDVSASSSQSAVPSMDTVVDETNGSSEVSRQEADSEADIFSTTDDSSSCSYIIKQAGGGPIEEPEPSPKDVEAESRGGGDVENGTGEKQTPGEAEREEEVIEEPAPTVNVEEFETQSEDIESYTRMFYMGHFHSGDIGVQIDGQTVLISAKHGHYADEHGFVARNFVRKHVLPEEVVAEKLTSFLTGDGVLVIQGPYSDI